MAAMRVFFLFFFLSRTLAEVEVEMPKKHTPLGSFCRLTSFLRNDFAPAKKGKAVCQRRRVL